MANKYLKLNTTGNMEQEEALVTSSGASDSGKIVALSTDGKLDPSTYNAGSGATTIQLTASENLTAGNYVNIHDSTGAKVRNASNTAIGFQAHGFVKSDVTSGNTATIYLNGAINDSLSGLTTFGYDLFLGVSGGYSTVPPIGSGNIVQRVGVINSATSALYVQNQAIIVA